MNADPLIAEFSELFTPPTKGLPMHSLERFIHPPSPTGLGDAAISRCVYVARTNLPLGGGRVIPRGTVLEPGLIDDPRRLVGAKRVWAIDAEPLGFVLAAQAASHREGSATPRCQLRIVRELPRLWDPSFTVGAVLPFGVLPNTEELLLRGFLALEPVEEQSGDKAESGHPTREAQLHKVHSATRAESDQDEATNARARARVNSCAGTPHPGASVADSDEAEQGEQPHKPATNARTPARQSFPPDVRVAPSVAESTGHRGSRLRKARAWLQAALANGPRPAAELFDEADEALHSRRNIERACSELGVESFQEGRAWWKRLPEPDRQLGQTVHVYARAREGSTE